jgi:hypothetical protein
MFQENSINADKLREQRVAIVTDEADLLTGKIQSKLNNPESNSDFDLLKASMKC